MARAMAARLLLRRSTSSWLSSLLEVNGQASSSFSSCSSSLHSRSDTEFYALSECVARPWQQRLWSAGGDSETAGAFLGLMHRGGASGNGHYNSSASSTTRSMYTDVAAARVGRRPVGVPESQVDALDGIEEMAAGAGATARMSIVLKSFEKIRPGKLKNVSKVGLPTTRILFTFNRSPHVDKKSREQFEMKTRKKLLRMEMDVGLLREKYNQLKNHNMLGVQLKVNFHYKTRLDMGRIQGYVPEATVVEQAEDQQKIEAKQ